MFHHASSSFLTKKRQEETEIKLRWLGINWKESPEMKMNHASLLIPCIPHPPKLESAGRMLLISSFIELTHTSCNANQSALMTASSTLLLFFFLCNFLHFILTFLPNWGFLEQALLNNHILLYGSAILSSTIIFPPSYFMHSQVCKSVQNCVF